MRLLRREFSKRLKTSGAEEVLALADALVDLGDEDSRFIAYELLLFHKPALTAIDSAWLTRVHLGIMW